MAGRLIDNFSMRRPRTLANLGKTPQNIFVRGACALVVKRAMKDSEGFLEVFFSCFIEGPCELSFFCLTISVAALALFLRSKVIWMPKAMGCTRR